MESQNLTVTFIAFRLLNLWAKFFPLMKVQFFSLIRFMEKSSFWIYSQFSSGSNCLYSCLTPHFSAPYLSVSDCLITEATRAREAPSLFFWWVKSPLKDPKNDGPKKGGKEREKTVTVFDFARLPGTHAKRVIELLLAIGDDTWYYSWNY